MAVSLDSFLPHLSVSDTKRRLQLGSELQDYFADPDSSVECEDIGRFVDSLVPWLQGSNFKVAQNGLEVLTHLVLRMQDDFKAYLTTVLPPTVDRLGDPKDIVRERAQLLLSALMENVLSPGQLFEKLLPAFSHKNGRVREEIMACLRMALTNHGSGSLSLSKLVPSLVRLLSDPTPAVRDAAGVTLVEIYRHVGERLRLDLQKKHSIPQPKLMTLLAKFDEIKDAGLLLPTATQTVDVSNSRGEDEGDRSISASRSVKRSTSAPPVKRSIFINVSKGTNAAATPSSGVAFKTPKTPYASSQTPSSSSLKKVKQAALFGAGGVDEETFVQAFQEVPSVQVFSGRDVEDVCGRVHYALSDPNHDWSKRVEQLRKLRGLVLAGGAAYEELFNQLRQLELPFQTACKDLRSQVVREACITIAFLAQQLGSPRFDHFAEALLPALVNLIQNSAKVMSTAGIVAIRFIIRHVQSPRLVPLITLHPMSSKSKEIRRNCCEFLAQMLHSWSTHAMEKHVSVLQDALRKGVADADPEARAASRKAYWAFADHFPDHADALLNSFDAAHRKQVQGEGGAPFSSSLSASSSSNSLHTAGRGIPTASGATGVMSSRGKSRATSIGGSTENLHRVPSLPRRSALPVLASSRGDVGKFGADRVREETQQTKPVRQWMGYFSTSRKATLPPVMNPWSCGSRSTGAIRKQFVRPANAMNLLEKVCCERYLTPPKTLRQLLSEKVPTKGFVVTRAQWSKKSSEVIDKRGFQHGGSGRSSPTPSPALRSNSAIDLQAAQRAKARAQYAAAARLKIGSGASLRDEQAARPRRPSEATSPLSANVSSPERVGRTRTRSSGVSQSQPSSRSGSPSSRLSYATYASNTSPVCSDVGSRGRWRGGSVTSGLGGAHSTGTSRETSPNRMGHFDRTHHGSKLRTRMKPERVPVPSRPVMAQKILQQSREAESALADALTVTSRKTSRPFEDHSDDSETSSLCSERSYEAYRRPSDPYTWSGSQQRLYRENYDANHMKEVPELIACCASNHWGERKDGLAGLQFYLRNGNLLSPVDLKKVTDVFNRLFVDPYTKAFTLVLDAVAELLIAHAPDLHDWLYVLLARTLTKLGTDVLTSVQLKLHRVLALTRDNFPPHLQLIALSRFLSDHNQLPSPRVRLATLAAIRALATERLTPADLKAAASSREFCPALIRLVTWAAATNVSGSDLVAKGIAQPEVRRAAREALLALFDVSASEMTRVLVSLSPEVQDVASRLLHLHVRQTSAAGGHQASGGGPASLPSKLSPAEEMDDPEEVQRSLRRTTAEIQSYSFEGVGVGERESSASQDSGISQMEERLEELRISNSGSGRSSGLSSPSHHHRQPFARDMNGLGKSMTMETDAPAMNNGTSAGNGTEGGERGSESSGIVLTRLVDEIGSTALAVRPEERRAVISQLLKLIRESPPRVVLDNFKILFRILLERLKDEDHDVRSMSLVALSEMLRQRHLSDCFQGFTELLLMKVLEAHRDPDKDVLRSAEACAGAAALELSPDQVITVLNPIIKTGEYPVNQAAVKMMTRLAESCGRGSSRLEALSRHLPDVIDGLIKAYDSLESSVRKAAVFCMVSLHQLFGEETMAPLLAPLNGSKLKLLHLYIRRAQQGGGGGSPSTASSPRNTTP